MASPCRLQPERSARCGVALAPRVSLQHRIVGKSSGLIPRGSEAVVCNRERDGAQLNTQDRAEVLNWLNAAGLGHLVEPLLANGFDDMESLQLIEDSDLREIGIAPLDAARLRRSLQAPSEEEEEGRTVVSFLRDAGLLQYADVLLQSGFDDMETLLEIEDTDFNDLGIRRGHAVKLKRRLREYRSEAGLHQVFHQQPQARGLPAPQRASGGLAPKPVFGTALPNQKGRTAVERSWEQVRALGSYAVAERLYWYTFQLAPDLADLFPPEVQLKYRNDTGGTQQQHPVLRKHFAKYINIVGSTVAGLHDLNRLVPMLTQLGARHVSYGVQESHWAIMGKGLTLTLRDCLGSSFTAEVENAWMMVYDFMSSIMLQGFRAAVATKSVAARESVSQCAEGNSRKGCHSKGGS